MIAREICRRVLTEIDLIYAKPLETSFASFLAMFRGAVHTERFPCLRINQDGKLCGKEDLVAFARPPEPFAQQVFVVTIGAVG